MSEYIEREAAVHLLMTRGRYLTKDLVMDAAYEVSKIPAADVVPVVRCKDCKSSRELNEKERMCVCSNALICKNSEAHVDGWNPVWPTDYCSYGERKEADGNG